MVDQDFEVYTKTIFGEASGEIKLGQQWVAWVIKNRAFYWKKTISEVCLERNEEGIYQFECWKGRDDIEIPKNELPTFLEIRKWARDIYKADQKYDITDQKDGKGSCMHFNNPQKEKAAWTLKAIKSLPIGNHVFYWF